MELTVSTSFQRGIRVVFVGKSHCISSLEVITSENCNGFGKIEDTYEFFSFQKRFLKTYLNQIF